MTGENLFCQGQRKPNARYDEGYYRTFKTPPKMGGPVRKMLGEFIEKEEFTKVLIFFMNSCKADYDYACYLLGELIAGDL